MYGQVRGVLAVEYDVIFDCQVAGGFGIPIILELQRIKQASEPHEAPIKIKDLDFLTQQD